MVKNEKQQKAWVFSEEQGVIRNIVEMPSEDGYELRKLHAPFYFI